MINIMKITPEKRVIDAGHSGAGLEGLDWTFNSESRSKAIFYQANFS